jgi:hypothetical protein
LDRQLPHEEDLKAVEHAELAALVELERCAAVLRALPPLPPADESTEEEEEEEEATTEEESGQDTAAQAAFGTPEEAFWQWLRRFPSAAERLAAEVARDREEAAARQHARVAAEVAAAGGRRAFSARQRRAAEVAAHQAMVTAAEATVLDYHGLVEALMLKREELTFAVGQPGDHGDEATPTASAARPASRAATAAWRECRGPFW